MALLALRPATRIYALIPLLAILGAAGPAIRPAAAAKPVYASIVVDANTGEVLHSVDADKRTYPASTTKIMTLYLLFEELQRGRLKLDTMLPVSEHAASQAPSKLGVPAGARVSVRDAMLGLVTKSANDMAVVVAEAIAGSEKAFAARMTTRARMLGMRSTRFKNASGLPDPDQVTTARDLTVLALAMLRDHPRQYQVFSTRDFAFNGSVHANHNRLLNSYDGMDGIKTGYIRASGFNLVASAERNGRRLVGVVLGGNAPAWRDRHMAQLLDKAFLKNPPLQTADLGAKAAIAPATPGAGTIAAALKRRPGRPAPEPVIATVDSTPAPPVYAEEMDMEEPTVADLVSDDAAEAIDQSGDWGIQVGAFKMAQNAQRAADDARRLLPPNVAGARPVIDEVSIRRSKLYQARLMGMSESDARAVCRQFKKKKQECLAVPPSVPGVSPGQQQAHTH
ncbi:MAG: D-alanyl-D-alanine carboxypeptidase [Alphaproteobacteria bacterium]|nr:D-alanyl-D-alanine carboxypeptidase [Alphaproteobacteria bacterium]